MNDLATIRLELGINAQRIISEYRSNNIQLDQIITSGIEKAMEEIFSDNTFENIIKEKTKKEIADIVHKAVFSYEVRFKIEKAIADKIDKKIEIYADKIAEQVTSALK